MEQAPEEQRAFIFEQITQPFKAREVKQG